jgi:hypothetical protein
MNTMDKISPIIVPYNSGMVLAKISPILHPTTINGIATPTR